MYNKTIIKFGFRTISWIIKTSCLYYLPQNTDLGFDNSRYHAHPHPVIVYYTINIQWLLCTVIMFHVVKEAVPYFLQNF